MKVLFVHTYYKQRGGEDAVFENEMELCSSAVEVHKFTLSNSGSFVSVLFKLLFAPFNFVSVSRFKKVLTALRPDVVHLHNWHFAASPAIIYAAKRKNIPVVCTLHNFRLICPSATLFFNGEIFLASTAHGFPWTAVKKKVYRNSYLQTFWLAITVRLHRSLATWQSVDRYMALTAFAKNMFLHSDLKLKDEQIVVKANSAADKGFNVAERAGFFLFAGRLTDEKGIEVLLKAFKGSIHSLKIVGEGRLQNEVKQACDNNPQLSYLGPISNNETIELMKNATALIFPSVWFEGMPLTILEAFSTGTPVIASKLGAMEAMIKDGENGRLYKAGDAEELRTAIDEWSNLSKQQHDEYCRNARRSYEMDYSEENNLQQLLSIYNSVTKKVVAAKN